MTRKGQGSGSIIPQALGAPSLNASKKKRSMNQQVQKTPAAVTIKVKK